MIRFDGEVIFRKAAQGRTAGDGKNPSVDHHGTGFAGMIGAQVGYQSWREWAVGNPAQACAMRCSAAGVAGKITGHRALRQVEELRKLVTVKADRFRFSR